MPSPSGSPLLAANGLSVEFRSTERVVAAVRGVSFTVGRGETVAIVGESGSGKSVTALSLMRLVEHGGGRIIAVGPASDAPTGNPSNLGKRNRPTCVPFVAPRSR